MNKILIIFFILCSPLLSISQIDLDTTKSETLDGQKVYLVVESWPKFVGGEKALELFIQNNISPHLRKIDSKIFISIIIDKFGMIREPEVLLGKNEAQINESLRIIKIMPRWIPGRLKGENVYVRIPIKFDFDPRK
jgi:hypothetical protein